MKYIRCVNENKHNLIGAITIIALVVSLRLLPHPPNMAPIASMALFGGFYLDKKFSVLLPLIALFLSDFIIGFYNPSLMIFVYASFALSFYIGNWLKKHKSAASAVSAVILSSLSFYVITNFGVWLTGTIYPKTLSGLLDCYILALPFFKNTLIGDFIYAGIFFGGYVTILKYRFGKPIAKIS